MMMKAIAFGWLQTWEEPGENWVATLVAPESRVQYCHTCGKRFATYIVSLVVPDGQTGYSEPACIECVLLSAQQSDYIAVTKQ